MNIFIVLLQGNGCILFYVNSLQYCPVYIRCLSNWNTIGQISHKKNQGIYGFRHCGKWNASNQGVGKIVYLLKIIPHFEH
jgi:hypothetical protein